jgi:hypothetical protein
MPIATGGLLAEGGVPNFRLHRLIQRIGDFAPRQSDEDYVVDIAFRTWRNASESEFTGVRAGSVGRSQRRVIIWHGVPVGLDTDEAISKWLAEVLPETSRLLREWLPTRSKKYPAQELANEVDALRNFLQDN